MKKLYALLLWSFFAYAVGTAQPVNNLVGDIVMPAPNAASLGKYTDVPVSHFTGVPSIGIDIYTVQEGPISLPVSLSYHASGIRVSETASWVGLGWSLNAGGMITRSVQGLPDENAIGYYNTGSTLTDSQNDFIEVARNLRDSEPDIFSFNFPGYTGKFYFDGDGVPHFIPKQDLKLVVNPAAGTMGIDTFRSFTIITPVGVRYIFGEATRSNGSKVNAWEQTESPGEPEYKFSSWYLLRVESADRNYAIDLNYVSDNYSYKSPVHCKYVKVNCSSSDFSSASAGTECPTDIGYAGGPLYIPTTVRTVKLSSIECSTSTVTFISNTTRQDLDPGDTSSPTTEALDSIKIESGQFCQKFHFSYNYFKDNRLVINQRSESKRLKLVSLQQTSCEPNPSIIIPPYTFEYFGALNTEDGSSFFPHLLDKGVDHWGFYNGADGYPIPNSSDSLPDNNQNLVNVPPTVVQTPYGPESYGSAARSTHGIFVKYATLNRINYPTGGSTSFEFEAHSYPSTITEKFYLLSNVPFTSCPGPYQGNCCDTKTNTSNFISFNSLGEIDSARFDLIIDRDTSSCTAANPLPFVKIEILNASGSVIGMNTITLADGENLDSIANVPLSTIASLSASTNYRFRITTFNGYGRFYLYTTRTLPSDKLVGGLRIKRIQIHDGISSSNDIIRTYVYKNSTLLFEPRYGHFLFGRVLQPREPPFPWTTALAESAIFSPESIIPLSSLEGYHIGYKEVEEIAGDNIEVNGLTRYEFALDTSGYDDVRNLYPVPPVQANVLNGKTTHQQVMNADSIEMSSIDMFPRTPSVTSSTTYMFKLSPPLSCPQAEPGTNSLFFITPYKMESPTDYQLIRKVETIDGVSSTTDYTFDNQNRHLNPIAATITNSNGKTYLTRQQYPFDYSGIVYDSLVYQNRLIPLETTQDVIIDNDTTQIGGSRTDYAFYNTSGQRLTSGSNGFPRPYRMWNYEMTWKANGEEEINEDPAESPNQDGWALHSTINSYHADNTSGKGYLAQSTVYGWQPQYAEWENGLITSLTYENAARTATYYSGTRLAQTVTDIDGQQRHFEWDDLMRLTKIWEKQDSIVTTISYHYPGGGNDRFHVRTETDYHQVTGSALNTMTTVDYRDGLNRPIQQVLQAHSPTQKDVVTVTEYDNQGRTAKVYEPFATSASNGAFATSIPTFQPHTSTSYEPSPLNRPIRVSPPDWFATTTEYGANAANEVYDYEQDDYYSAGELRKTVTTDPEDNQVITFTDKLGRLILTRRDSNDIGGVFQNDTYHLYDDKNRPVLILPPGATLDSAELVYQKRYDVADNLIYDKIPGKDSVIMQYDSRELPTAMQDGNMKADRRWLVTNFDVHGRTIATGFHNSTGTPAFDNPVIHDSLTVSFYDGKTESDSIAGAQYIGRLRKGKTAVLTNDLSEPIWLENTLTYDQFGRVIENVGNNFINLGQFDAEEETYRYDWLGNIVHRERIHQLSGQTTLNDRMTFDHQGRQQDTYHRINQASEVQISNLQYTVKDELKQRNLGRTGPNWLQQVDYVYNAQGWLTRINDELDPVSLQGGLQKSAASSDLFYMLLNYNISDNNLDAPAQINGNISNIKWQVQGKDVQAYGFRYDYLDRLTQSVYGEKVSGFISRTDDYSTSYQYDARGNIKKLTRNGLYTGTKQQIDNLTYSYYGSSNQIKRITDAAECPTDLEFAEPIEHDGTIQATNSITLKPGTTISGQEVTISAGSCTTNEKYTGGFVQRSTDDYEYDANGNLITDPNRKATLTYNHLNLVEKAEWYEDGTPKQIEWLYDASGTKLTKSVRKNDTLVSSKLYFGEIEYDGNQIEAIYHAEGRAVPDGSSGWEYQYRIADNLGNTRVLFRNNGSGQAEMLEILNYYPFGYVWEEEKPEYPFTYNHKRWDNDFGLGFLEFEARPYSPLEGRFLTVDPISDQFPHLSVFNYASNNPVTNIDLWGLQGVNPNDDGEVSREYERDDEGNLTGVRVGYESKGGSRTGSISVLFGGFGSGEGSAGGLRTDPQQSTLSILGQNRFSHWKPTGTGYGLSVNPDFLQYSPFKEGVADIAWGMMSPVFLGIAGGGYSSSVGGADAVVAGAKALRSGVTRGINLLRLSRALRVTSQQPKSLGYTDKLYSGFVMPDRAPRGGIRINGKFYQGGQFLPGARPVQYSRPFSDVEFLNLPAVGNSLRPSPIFYPQLSPAARWAIGGTGAGLGLYWGINKTKPQ